MKIKCVLTELYKIVRSIKNNYLLDENFRSWNGNKLLLYPMFDTFVFVQKAIIFK